MEEMDFDAKGLRQKASGKKRENKQLFARLRVMRSSDADTLINSLHDRVVRNINCLECANCCTTISPAIRSKDIDKIAGYLKKKASEITDKYMYLDEEGDYVFKSQPCPFLGSDNYCEIYPARPRACREYPHTDRKKQQQILDISFQNISVCPIVFGIVEDLKRELS